MSDNPNSTDIVRFHSAVATALDELGNDVPSITKRLLELDCKGVKRMSSCCPIAVYPNKQLETTNIMVCRTRIWQKDTYNEFYPIPEGVISLVNAFDSHWLPELELVL